MVAKSKKPSTGTKKGRVKVGKLKLNKETVKDLITSEQKMVRGGLAGLAIKRDQTFSCGGYCTYTTACATCAGCL